MKNKHIIKNICKLNGMEYKEYTEREFCITIINKYNLKFEKNKLSSFVCRSIYFNLKGKLDQKSVEVIFGQALLSEEVALRKSMNKIKRKLDCSMNKSKGKKKSISDTDWDVVALFFGREICHLKVVSNLPSSKFYNSVEWRKLRYSILKGRKNRCECCGTTSENKSLHIDHIKPRSIFPNNSLNPQNLQILCEDCNMAKSNTDFTDWRKL